MSSSGLVRLKGTVQHYDWGKIGTDSLVAQYGYSGSLTKIDPAKPAAELWIGTHPNGPSDILDEAGSENKGSLKEWLKENPTALVAAKGNNSTPQEVSEQDGLCFLFKILSIAKALSIQVHPNKRRAEELFAQRPDIYKDPNHKPEMACALTDFEAFLGFERLEIIVENVESTPELRDLVTVDGGEAGEKAWKDLVEASKGTDQNERKSALRQFFALFMASDPKNVEKRVQELVARITASKSPSPKKERMDSVDALALRLHTQFPNDVGIFCSYVMCYRKLEPGQAVFLAANEPHAYLSGDCVEVMANSDNVIRAALTPKYKDLKELEECLTYNEPPAVIGEGPGWHPCQVVPGQQRDAKTVVFVPADPAVTEFQLERTKINEPHVGYTFAIGTYGSVIFVTEGTGEAKWDQGMQRIPLFRGATFFLPAGAKVSIFGDLVVYRCTKRGST